MTRTEENTMNQPLRLTVGIREFRTAYADAPKDSAGTASVRTIAEALGATYLAAAERASDECYAARAGLSGPTTDMRVSLHPQHD